jgi:hypothetical protein
LTTEPELPNETNLALPVGEVSSSDAQRGEDTAPAPTPVQPLTPTPAPSAFARLSTEPRSVLGASLDLLTRSAAELRRASLYVGVLILGTVGPLVLLLWGAAASDYDFRRAFARDSGLPGWVSAGEFLAVLGIVMASIESRAVGSALLAARLDERPLSLKDAIRRSRMVFWRLVGVSIVVNLPLFILQALLDARLAELFSGRIDISDLTATLIVAVIGTPLAYATTSVVLGDVGPIEAARRSILLFRARKRSAVVVSLLAVIAQLLTAGGLLTGLDIVVRVIDTLKLDPTSGSVSIALITVILVAITFAGGSLLFTVNAIALAPQVVMFAALTHVAPGLDAVRTEPIPAPWSDGERPFRWFTLPLLGGFVLGAIVLFGGLASLSR